MRIYEREKTQYTVTVSIIPRKDGKLFGHSKSFTVYNGTADQVHAKIIKTLEAESE